MKAYSKAVLHRNGPFSEIYRAIGGTGRVVALKVTNAYVIPPHDSRREIRLLGSLHHPNIIELIESFEDDDDLVLVLPFIAQNLEDCISKLSISEIKRICGQVTQALAYVHSHCIIHRDIKPSNILLDGLSPKLADFGIAWNEQENYDEPPDRKITDVGSTVYRAPELLFGFRAYSFEIDLWSWGCTIARFFTPDHKNLFDDGGTGSELALIGSIMKTLGTPTLETWAEATDLPDFTKIQFRTYPKKSWSTLLPSAEKDAIEVVASLVQYSGSRRLPAKQILHYSFFNSALGN